MKNLFLILTLIALTFQSCSSDDESINDPMVEACETPTNLSITEITADSATLNWESPNDNTAVEVEYGLTGFSPGTGNVVSTSQNSTSISNLSSGKTYDFYVQAVCTLDNMSAQSSVASFTTEVVLCLTPINLSVSEITADSAILNWESPNDNTAVEVEYGLTGFSPGTGTVVSTSQNTISIEGLIPSSSYDFYVQAVCAADNMSPQSEVTSFTTTDISPFAGTWSGTFAGDDTGSWVMVISANGDLVSGSFYSNNVNATVLVISGTLTPNGYLTTINEIGGTNEGQITGETISGTWVNASAGISGTWTGSRE